MDTFLRGEKVDIIKLQLMSILKVRPEGPGRDEISDNCSINNSLQVNQLGRAGLDAFIRPWPSTQSCRCMDDATIISGGLALYNIA